jgi:Xaa-Pro aminopeptidase
MSVESLNHVRDLMSELEVSALCVLSATNFRYLTDISTSRGILLITPVKAFVLIDQRYAEMASSLPPEFDVIAPSASTDIYSVLKTVCAGLPGPIAYDPSTTSVELFQKVSTYIAPLELHPHPTIFSRLRRPKHASEIKAIERACSLCAEGFAHLISHIREGVTETELSRALKLFWFSHGADGLSFEPIIAFGVHSACPHWSASPTPLSPNSTILIDIGVQLDSYNSDMTRTIFFGGPDPEILTCHKIVQQVYRAACADARPGVLPVALDAMVRQRLTALGYGEAFIHGLGHGVGLEIHEPPRLSMLMKDEHSLLDGDVITIEPGIYLPELGGVRIENTVLITPEGAKPLISTPIEPLFLS